MYVNKPYTLRRMVSMHETMKDISKAVSNCKSMSKVVCETGKACVVQKSSDK